MTDEIINLEEIDRKYGISVVRRREPNYEFTFIIRDLNQKKKEIHDLVSSLII